MYLGKLAARLAPNKKHLQFLQSKSKLNGLETRHRFRCRLVTPKNDAPLPLRGVRDDYKKKTTMNKATEVSKYLAKIVQGLMECYPDEKVDSIVAYVVRWPGVGDRFDEKR